MTIAGENEVYPIIHMWKEVKVKVYRCSRRMIAKWSKVGTIWKKKDCRINPPSPPTNPACIAENSNCTPQTLLSPPLPANSERTNYLSPLASLVTFLISSSLCITLKIDEQRNIHAFFQFRKNFIIHINSFANYPLFFAKIRASLFSTSVQFYLYILTSRKFSYFR